MQAAGSPLGAYLLIHLDPANLKLTVAAMLTLVFFSMLQTPAQYIQLARRISQKLTCCFSAQHAQREGYTALPAGDFEHKCRHGQQEGQTSQQSRQYQGAAYNVTAIGHQASSQLINSQADYKHAARSADHGQAEPATAHLPNGRTQAQDLRAEVASSITIPSSLQSMHDSGHISASATSYSHTYNSPQDNLLFLVSSPDTDHTQSQSGTPQATLSDLNQKETDHKASAELPAATTHSALSSVQPVSPFERVQPPQDFQRPGADAKQGRCTQSVDRRRRIHSRPSMDMSHSMRISNLSTWRSGSLAAASGELNAARSNALSELEIHVSNRTGTQQCPPPVLRVSSKTLDLVR